MPNPYFRFKQFTVFHDRSAMKVTTDSCLFGAWCAKEVQNQQAKDKTVLDIGTGTGLLSLMIAQKNEIPIDAIEIDDEAAAQAVENFVASPWKDHLKVVHTDAQTFQSEKKYKCIISNPPFYQNELLSSKQKRNLAHHSSQLTLAQLLNTIKKNLETDGVFYLLLPFKRMIEAEDLIAKNKFYIQEKVIVKQSLSHSPFRIMLKASLHQQELIMTTLSICTENQQYSNPFIELLKDYYLYL